MGIDIRVGRKDYFTRYRVYSPDVDRKDASIINKYCIGVLHAKDVTAYNTQADNIGGKFQFDGVQATIETQDKMTLGVDYWLYALAEKTWYKVVSVAPNSINEHQRFSARPGNVTQIVIRRFN